MKPSEAIITAAILAARQSPCAKSKRGVVLWDPNFSEGLYTGYNQPAIDTCQNNEQCRSRCSKICVHAEQMALLRATVPIDGWHMLHIKVDNCGQAVASGGPSCLECSKLVYTSGITTFWLLHEDGWKAYPVEEFHRKTLMAVFSSK